MKNSYFVFGLIALLYFPACKQICPPAEAPEPVIIRDTIPVEVEVEKIVRDTIYEKAENAQWARNITPPFLYLNCGNDLNFEFDQDVPNFNIKASNAEVIRSKSTYNKVRVVPTAKTTRLTVTQLIDGTEGPEINQDYKVIRPPKPTIEWAVNGKTSGATGPVPKSSRLQVRITPDSDFRANFPEDARYNISSIDVLMQASLGPPMKVNSINVNGKDANAPINISLGSQIRQARPGTTIYVRINDVYRRNWQNKQVKLNLGTQEKIFAFVIK